jgi:hypothetical protein
VRIKIPDKPVADAEVIKAAARIPGDLFSQVPAKSAQFRFDFLKILFFF